MSSNSEKNIFKKFVNSNTGSGVVLFTCVILALTLANTGFFESLNNFISTQVGFKNASIDLRYSLDSWVNDGLMAIFFFLVGLEIKREIVDGQLSSPRQAALPILAAMGGAIVPALFYFGLNYNEPTHHGWGVPMATDIAFALVVVSLLGKNVPVSLKVFLAALAIIDDLLAILVIAIFYSTELHFMYLLYAGIIIAGLILLNRFGAKNIWLYIIPGLFVWYFFHHSGIHATIAGVIVAMCIPTKGKGTETPPSTRLEHSLGVPVNFLIIPIFAFVNTLIPLHSEMLGGLTEPLGLGIMLGLVVGKPIGITFTCWICIRLGLSNLPNQATWKHIFAIGLLAGIGFTMSIFISMLSFDENLLIEEAKLSVLLGSLTAGLLGSLFLWTLGRRNKQITQKSFN